MNIAENLERARTFFPDKAAILFEGATWSYREIDESACRLAASMKAKGIGPGDRVALFLPNIPAFMTVYYAVHKIGAVAASISAMAKTGEVKHIVNDTGAKMLFTTEVLREHVPVDLLHTLERVVIAEGAAGDDIAMDELIRQGDDRFTTVDRDRDDPAAILYTSGTTGLPKGVVLTQGNIVSNVYSAVHNTGMCPEDRLQLFLPLFHCFGQNFIMNPAVNACATIVLHRRFEPNAVLDAVEKNGVTMFFAVPTIFIYLLNRKEERHDLSGVRYWFTAAATMPTEVAERWEEKVNKPVWEGYGLTECSPFAAYNHSIRHRCGSVGAPIENVEMKVVDEKGNEVLPGKWGEIVIKGPNVMKGYWNSPKETAKAIRDGWLRSGDIGMEDADGYFYVVDRVKDMINAAGFKVYPAEVEEVLYTHPSIREVAVYGVPDPVKGEQVKVSVVLKEKEEVSGQEIIDFCRERMAIFKAPRQVDFVEELPKSPTGKILKKQLRQELQ